LLNTSLRTNERISPTERKLFERREVGRYRKGGYPRIKIHWSSSIGGNSVKKKVGGRNKARGRGRQAWANLKTSTVLPEPGTPERTGVKKRTGKRQRGHVVRGKHETHVTDEGGEHDVLRGAYAGGVETAGRMR